MIYQILAYDVLEGLQVQVQTADATDTGYHWENRVVELTHVPEALQGDPWDALWHIANLIMQRAIERGRAQ
jgi:uncharacterized membrane protein